MHKLCRNFSPSLKIGKEEVVIDHGCGVKKGDKIAPTRFTIVI